MQDRAYPTLAAATRIWARIGLLSFGGPAGQIALMHRILVEEQRWLGEKRFLHALNYCMLLPGPEAMQLAVYIGWLMHRTLGGIIAGVLLVLPGVAAIMANTAIATAADLPRMAGAFRGAIEAGRAAYLAGPGRVLERLPLDFARRYVAGEPVRSIKSDPRFIEQREYVLSRVFEQREAFS